jgi:RNA polymerase sigma-70 factor, ECF subfamily
VKADGEDGDLRLPEDRLRHRLLVLTAQAGDETAFEELVTLHHAALRYYLRKMLSQKGERVEDLLQEVWLAVWRGLPRLEDPLAFTTWLYRIARNRTFSLLRARRTAERPIEEALEVDTGPEPELSAANCEWIHAGLDRLSPAHREVLLLRFVENLSYEEIARVTECQVGTVRSRLHHAKRALRSELERIDDHGRT